MSQQWVILDRDGVINQDIGKHVCHPDECVVLPNVGRAIGLLNKHGYHVAVATNQSGIASGLFDEARLAAIHKKIAHKIANHHARIEGWFYCPHARHAKCACRKPQPGLLTNIASWFDVNIADTPFLGDSDTDLQAAKTIGMPAILIGSGERAPTQTPDAHYPCLYTWTQDFLAHRP